MIINWKESLYSYDTLITDAKMLAKQYSNILQCKTIGTSHDGRDIILLKLGVGQNHMVCCAGVHARETVNPVVLLKIVEYYAELYSNYRQHKSNLHKKLRTPSQNLEWEYQQMLYRSCIHELLKTFTILIVPLLNPDGYMIAQEGFEVIRDQRLRQKCISMNIPNTEWKYNASGMDINRNFPSRLWKPKFTNDYPASENETKALIALFNDYTSKGFLDFHSRGRQIYYYRNIMPDNYNTKQLEIARSLQKVTNYELVPSQEEMDSGDSGGNTVHYYSETFNKPALTLESVEETAPFPLDYQYRYSAFEELKLVIFAFGSLIV